MFIVFETWEFELLTSDIYRPVYKSRHQNEVNPDQATKSKRPREGNFHDAGFLPPHPHLLHHGHWVGCQSSHNHPWHHYIQTITVVFTRFWHCTMHMSHLFLIWEFDKVLLVPALQNTSWSRLRMLLRRVEQTTTKIGALGVMVVPLATTNGSPRALGVVVPPVGRGWPMMPVLRCQRLWWNSLWFL